MNNNNNNKLVKYNGLKFYSKVLSHLKLELVTAAHFMKNELAKRFVLAAGTLYVLWHLKLQ